MDINISHICNTLSLKLLAEYYNSDYTELLSYYDELEKDQNFISELIKRIDKFREHFPRGLFLNRNIKSIDWFGNQRITLYVLIRLLKPEICVETGVFYGGSTAFILNALKKNQKGKLISIDLPADKIKKSITRHENVGSSEIIPKELQTGFIIPDYLKEKWELIEDDSHKALRELKHPFNFFSHDSEHSRNFMIKELEIARSQMPENSTIFADDINWSNAFFEFCVNNNLYPLILTDNGKDELKARLGVVRLDHPNNNKEDITG